MICIFYNLERQDIRPAFCMKFFRTIDRAECHSLRQKHIYHAQLVYMENKKEGEVSCTASKIRENVTFLDLSKPLWYNSSGR